MSHDLHSLIDQAVERNRRSIAAEPVTSSGDDAPVRLSRWQAELALFSEEFQRDVAELLEDVAQLTAEPTRAAPAPPAMKPDEHPDSGRLVPQETSVAAVASPDQEQDRLSALKERLSRQLQTRTAAVDATNAPPPLSPEGSRP